MSSGLMRRAASMASPASVRSLGDEAAAVEDLNNGVGDERFVVYDEDPGGRCRRCCVAIRMGGCRRHRFASVAGEKIRVHGGPCIYRGC